MKRKISIAILLLICTFAVCIFAGSNIPLPTPTANAAGSLYWYTVTDGEATITYDSTAVSGALTIPEKLNGYPVTAIGEQALCRCDGLTSVTIPTTVKTIMHSAFFKCPNLTTLTVPGNVETIEYNAFYECTGLTTVTLCDGVKTIGDSAFYGCSNLTKITVPDSVTSIGTGAAIPKNAVMYVNEGSYAYYWAIDNGREYVVSHHSLNYVEAKAATCEELGNYAHYKCSFCGKLFTDSEGKNETTLSEQTIPHTWHKLTKVAYKEATCTENGNNAYWQCAYCKEVFDYTECTISTTIEAQTIKATGHSLTLVPYKAATCQQIGNYAYYQCTACKKVFTDAKGTNATTVEAQKIPMTGHSLTKVEAKASTCTENGNNAYRQCIWCEKVFENTDWTTETTIEAQTVYAKGHKLVKVAYKDATCTDTGNTNYFKCSVCGELFSNGAGTKATTISAVTIKAKGHKLVKVAYKAATCTSTGNNAYYKCSVCKKVFTDTAGTRETTIAAQTIKATGHSLTLVPYKAATCQQIGNYAYYQCTACKKVFTDAKGTNATTVEAQKIPMTGHSLTKVEAKASTCTENGNNAYRQCIWCEKVFENTDWTTETTIEAQTVYAKGHKLVKVAYKDATCTDTGNTNYFKCSVCGELFSNGAGTKATTISAVTIKAKGHKLVKVAYKAATCTATGNNAYYKCSVCKKVYKDAAGTKETTIAATTINATGHKLTKVAYKDATCTNAGNTNYFKCSVCGELFSNGAGTKTTTISAVTIKAKGHKLVKVAYKAATCTSTGNNAYYKCSVCKKVFTDTAGTKETTLAATTINATGHSLTLVPYKAATCQQIGNYAYYKCTACKKVFTDAKGTNETTVKAQTLPLTGHSLTKVEAKAATCTENGNNAYRQCIWCEKVFENTDWTAETTIEAQTIYAKGHKIVKVAYKDATCTDTGNTNYFKCSVCGKLFSNGAGTKATTISAVTIKAKGHKLVKVAYKAATCTATGNNAYYKCSVCKKVFADANGTKTTTIAATTIKATGHKLTKIAYKDATCTNTGNTNYFKCSVCGKLFSNGAGTKATTLSAVTIKAKGHKLVKVAYKAATCTSTGNNAYYKCSVCKKVFTDTAGSKETTLAAQTIKATGHKLTKVAYKDATCTNTGNTNYFKCSVCGELFSNGAGTKATTISAVTIKAKGHKLVKVAYKAATCTATGNNAYYKCSVCKKVFADANGTKTTTVAAQTIKATGHNIIKVAKKDATCTEAGNYTYYECSTCKKAFVDAEGKKATTAEAQTIKAKGHKLTKTASKAATCTTNGNNIYYTCSVCKKVYKDAAGTKETTIAATTINATGHKLTKIAYKDATCTNTGNTNYFKCSVCEKLFSNGAGTKATTLSAVTIKAKGHKLVKVAYKAATCTATGNYAYYKCATCKKVFVDAEGKKATTIEEQTIKAKGHNLTMVAKKSATCTSGGNNAYYTCSVCKNAYSDANGQYLTTVSGQKTAALGHNYSSATCTSAGKCTRCGKSSGSALGHSWTSATCTSAKKCTRCGKTSGSALGHSWKSATCTSAKKCSRCGLTQGNALGHNWNTGVVTKKATCTKTGIKTYTCTRCGTKKTSTIETIAHKYGTNGYCTVCGTSRKTIINLPSLPQIICDCNYSNKPEEKVEITSMTISQKYYSYDNTITATITVKGKATYNYRGTNQSTCVAVGWKLYDSENCVIDSGTYYTESVLVGESFKGEIKIFDLTPGETYTLKILSTN